MKRSLFTAVIAVAAMTAPTLAGYTIIQQNGAAPTYSQTLNFDEPGGPTGIISQAAFSSIGLADLNAGDGQPVVADHTASPGGGPWIGSGNSFFGNFGVFMTFDTDLTDFSAQFWDPSGTPSPFGGGMGIFIFDDGVEVGNAFVTPAWGGLGDSWFDIKGTGGMVFDEIRVLGFGFGPTTFMDNASWNGIPEPGALALLSLGAALLAGRRR